jgi:hypothetical protein
LKIPPVALAPLAETAGSCVAESRQSFVQVIGVTSISVAAL